MSACLPQRRREFFFNSAPLRFDFERSSVSIQYIVLGAGRQGTASAYDLAKFGGADRVTMADVDRSVAQAAADRVNQLIGRSIADAIALDVKDDHAVRRAIKGYNVVLS